jgi:hypothetical protein
MVRDSNGYFHAFWHSKENPALTPSGSGCQIFYCYTLAPANEPPSMDDQHKWAVPVNMTKFLGNPDNRYPSVAIEYEIFDYNWRNVNKLHVVWQALLPGGSRYEVVYASIPVTNPPVAPVLWSSARNLSNTPSTDSLVPAIAINKYNPNVINQHIHVVWQEEDIFCGPTPTITPTWNPTVAPIWTPTPTTPTPTPPPVTPTPTPKPPAFFSDIVYIRSINSGQNWAGPAGGWNGHVWDNLTRSAVNSQMPSISCALDQYTGLPYHTGRKEFGYNSDDVHVSYNEDIPGGINVNVYYLRSPNDGLNWNPRINISQITGGNRDAYSNIAVDMRDNPHIVFMRDNLNPWDPTFPFLPGKDPSDQSSFPGPEVGMYGTLSNSVVYAYFNGTAWTWNTFTGTDLDLEFPTVALDRWQHLNVNWQQYNGQDKDYEVMRATNLNLNAPRYPLLLQSYQGWSRLFNDSNDSANDDLFPNLAHKKVAMYRSPNESGVAGYDEIWTKIIGHGDTAAALASPKNIRQDGNMTLLTVTPPTPTPPPPPTP